MLEELDSGQRGFNARADPLLFSTQFRHGPSVSARTDSVASSRGPAGVPRPDRGAGPWACPNARVLWAMWDALRHALSQTTELGGARVCTLLVELWRAIPTPSGPGGEVHTTAIGPRCDRDLGWGVVDTGPQHAIAIALTACYCDVRLRDPTCHPIVQPSYPFPGHGGTNQGGLAPHPNPRLAVGAISRPMMRHVVGRSGW